MPPVRRTPRTHRERGVVILWLALFLLLMLGFIAVGVDLAKLLATRSQLQNAADAAALAAATAVVPGAATPTLDQAGAKARAVETGGNNKAFINDAQPVVVLDADITFPQPNVVTVVARRDNTNGTSVIGYFIWAVSQLVPGTNVRDLMQARATASAKVEPAGAIPCGTLPVAAVPLQGQNWQAGQVYDLKSSGGTGGQGNYGSLQLPDCPNGTCGQSGANDFRCWLRDGYCCTVKVGDVLLTEPGNMSGPTRQGIVDRFDADEVKTPNITYNQYMSMGGSGQRVVVVPITTTLPQGQGPVTVLGFAAFFLRNIPDPNQADIYAEFVDVVYGGTPGGTISGNTAFAVHLVPNPNP